jgi:hypothetical protein
LVPQHHFYGEVALGLGSAMLAFMERNPVLRSALRLHIEVCICGPARHPADFACSKTAVVRPQIAQHSLQDV